jgi:hypothetical protein
MSPLRIGLVTAMVIALLEAAAGHATAQAASRGGPAPVAPAEAAAPARWDAWSPIDNAHVHVQAATAPSATAGSLPQVRVWLDGHVEYLDAGARAESHAATGSRGPAGGVIMTELKDTRIPPHRNTTSYPLAFPRPNVRKVLENDRVIVWDYSWAPGVPTPMHFHDKDVVVTYLEDGALRSTEPDGKSAVNPHYFGFTKFNAGDRTHTEELIQGRGRAIIVELKR